MIIIIINKEIVSISLIVAIIEATAEAMIEFVVTVILIAATVVIMIVIVMIEVIARATLNRITDSNSNSCVRNDDGSRNITRDSNSTGSIHRSWAKCNY